MADSSLTVYLFKTLSMGNINAQIFICRMIMYVFEFFVSKKLKYRHMIYNLIQSQMRMELNDQSSVFTK